MKYAKISGFSDEIAEDVAAQFAVLRKLNICYFEPRGIDGKNISRLTDEEVAGLREKMQAYGIQVSSIGSPVGKVKLEEDFEEHFRQFQRVVEIAGKLGARYIRVFSFYHAPHAAMGGNAEGAASAGSGGAASALRDGKWNREERAEVLARLRRMIAYAEEKDVVLLHENEKDIYGDTVDRCADLMQELGGPHFQAVFDPANFVQCGQDTKEAFDRLKEFIAYVHVKDAFLKDGRVVPAGIGDGNVEYVLKSLFDEGYDGFLSLEPHLGSFAGLADLELDDKMQNLPQGGEGTFTLAYRALESIVDGLRAINQ